MPCPKDAGLNLDKNNYPKQVHGYIKFNENVLQYLSSNYKLINTGNIN